MNMAGYMENNTLVNNKTSLFNDLQGGLIQPIDYANGAGSARDFTRIIDPAKDSDKDQRRGKKSAREEIFSG